MAKILTLLIAIFFLGASASAQRVYKWKDKSGQWHFSNTPPAIPPKSEVTVTKVGKGSLKIVSGSGRVAEVISIIPRDEGTLIEILTMKDPVQQIIHLSTKEAPFQKGEFVEIFDTPKDKYSFIIRKWPSGGHDYVGTVPGPTSTK